jgi:hypothetical protein
MPKKFNKMVWIKKGNYLVIKISDDKDIDENNPKGIIENVLYENDIKFLKKDNKWYFNF